MINADEGMYPARTAPRLTPARVRATRFTRTPIGRRGFSEEEVLLFVQRVAEQIATRDAGEAALRAEISRTKSLLVQWQSEQRDLRGDDGAPAAAQPNVDAINILSKAQQEADAYVAQAQEYCRRLALDAREHAQAILVDAQARAEEAAEEAVRGYRARTGDRYTAEYEDLERRLAWARTFVTSLETVEAQLRTAREALAYEFSRLADARQPDQPA